jgi:hypothetical protein
VAKIDTKNAMPSTVARREAKIKFRARGDVHVATPLTEEQDHTGGKE